MIRPPSLVLVLVLALVPACTNRTSDAPCPGEHCLPSFTATTLDGTPVSRDSLRGKTVVVNFWATWCNPCVAEMPALRSIADRYRDRNVVIVGILSDARASDDEARAFLRNLGITYPIVRATPDIDRAFRPPPYLPVTYLYDARGVRTFGWTRALDEAELAAKLDAALQ